MAISKAELKKLRALKTKKGRSEQKKFLVEGVRVLEEALKFGLIPNNLIYSPTQLTKRARQLIESYKSNKAAVSTVSSKDLSNLSDADTPQGVIAVFERPESKLSKLYKPSYRRVLLCDMISDPGNLGTLIRTALAFEFDMIIATDKTVEIFSPKVVRSSAGTVFGIPIASASAKELADFKKSQKAKVFAAVPDGTSDIDAKLVASETESTSPLVLAIGSEADGLSDDVFALADHKLTIRHNRKVESLNAAVAGALLMQLFYKSENNK